MPVNGPNDFIAPVMDDKNADINAVNADGDTAMHLVAEFLCRHHDETIRDDDEEVYSYPREFHSENLQNLVSMGADPDIPNRRGMTVRKMLIDQGLSYMLPAPRR